jgi:hypothetical protein
MDDCDVWQVGVVPPLLLPQVVPQRLLPVRPTF